MVEELYKTNQCSKTTHVVHTGEKPCICKKCEFTNTQNSSLKTLLAFFHSYVISKVWSRASILSTLRKSGSIRLAFLHCVFSNVSSKCLFSSVRISNVISSCLLDWMHKCTGVAFLCHEFLNPPSKHLDQSTISCTDYICSAPS